MMTCWAEVVPSMHNVLYSMSEHSTRAYTFTMTCGTIGREASVIYQFSLDKFSHKSTTVSTVAVNIQNFWRRQENLSLEKAQVYSGLATSRWAARVAAGYSKQPGVFPSSAKSAAEKVQVRNGRHSTVTATKQKSFSARQTVSGAASSEVLSV